MQAEPEGTVTGYFGKKQMEAKMTDPSTPKVVNEVEGLTPNDPDAPMTGDQADLLRALCEDAGEPFDASLTQIQALRRIEELREIVNRDENL